MSKAPYRIELLQKQDRSAFGCGEQELNAYFRTRVSQDVRRNYATCFVAIDKAGDRIAGFYPLAMGSVPLGEFPEDVVKRLPRFPQIPVEIGDLPGLAGQNLAGVCHDLQMAAPVFRPHRLSDKR